MIELLKTIVSNDMHREDKSDIVDYITPVVRSLAMVSVSIMPSLVTYIVFAIETGEG